MLKIGGKITILDENTKTMYIYSKFCQKCREKYAFIAMKTSYTGRQSALNALAMSSC